ncbi:unnamed protein product [Adineta steineri]|uniref:Uncharacterized protein n=1 Tax=Adineta steineri TaxID=433720 RepID=A0A818J8X1_9BILA|nr:unnamed protein product [Adineta steineri]CAF3534398.1 unnamed protein product [Adineta steineri]
MSFKIDTCNETTILNKYGWHLRWPRRWIIILGIILLSLSIYIAAMEIGHTVFDLYRSTAFGGFIIFIPLLSCSILVLITAYIPRLIFIRIATILCCIMIVLCLVLIAYDILVLIDPTRCFILSCMNADVTYEIDSNYSTTITGWPLTIIWPDYFQIDMTAKRFFQGLQLFFACLFIFTCSLYISTYYIYRYLNLHRPTVYKLPELITSTGYIVNPYSQRNYEYIVPIHDMEDHPSRLVEYTHPPISQSIDTRTFIEPRTISVNYNQMCRRCMEFPRMISTRTYQQQNPFSYVCFRCNNELLNSYEKTSNVYPIHDDSIWTF